MTTYAHTQQAAHTLEHYFRATGKLITTFAFIITENETNYLMVECEGNNPPVYFQQLKNQQWQVITAAALFEELFQI